MSSTANITSLAALASLKAALVQFEEDARNALVWLELESRRPIEWIEHDRTRYWPAQVRKASDALSEARLALERCESSGSSDFRRDCYDERKALERAKRRLNLAEEKIEAVRRWRHALKKEVEAFGTELARLRGHLDADFLQAVAGVERMLEALDRYVAAGAAPAATEGASDAGS
jgi:hypothetical protein